MHDAVEAPPAERPAFMKAARRRVVVVSALQETPFPDRVPPLRDA